MLKFLRVKVVKIITERKEYLPQHICPQCGCDLFKDEIMCPCCLHPVL